MEFRHLGLEPVVCDVLEPHTLPRLPPVDTLLYCVGLDRTSGSSMRQVYVDGLANTLNQLQLPRRFLYISSTSVYGQTGGEVVDESAATMPLDDAGAVVLEAERLLQARWPGAVILRLAGIYGPGRLLRQQALLAGQPLATDPDKWLNLIHVEDAASVVLAAELRAGDGQIYNVCDDVPVQRRQFYAYLAQILGAPAPQFTAPASEDMRRGRDLANRRIRNERMITELLVQLRYPSYLEGLRDTMAGGP
jgi:nucleoside-diphosphate-sugar epimerase